jgi:hypothetical protein
MPMNPRLLVPRATFDADAAAYLRAVEAADGQALEPPVKRAVDDFFRGTKADGTFGALKASCILCGARTLAGALVPLAGDAPTNNNFVDADYNRETGLVGNGSSKYLNSNRTCDADGEDDRHWAFFSTTALSNIDCCFGADIAGTFSNTQVRVNTENFLFCASPDSTGASAALFANSGAQGFHGASRDNSASFVARSAGSAITKTVSSAVPPGDDLFFFARNTSTGASNHASTRLAFYSIGTAISDLALLDARVTALVTSIGAAI